MLIAIPLTGGMLAQHFGHCERFAMIEVDSAGTQIIRSAEIEAPEHQPGLLPAWLKQHGVTHVIAGGLGSRANSLLRDESIEVITGAPAENPATLVRKYLEGTLVTIGNSCEH
jgi:predicted Fe-Mo cluster-binding NifX family protein